MRGVHEKALPHAEVNGPEDHVRAGVGLVQLLHQEGLEVGHREQDGLCEDQGRDLRPVLDHHGACQWVAQLARGLAGELPVPPHQQHVHHKVPGRDHVQFLSSVAFFSWVSVWTFQLLQVVCRRPTVLYTHLLIFCRADLKTARVLNQVTSLPQTNFLLHLKTMSDVAQYRIDMNKAVDEAIECQFDLQAAKRGLFYLQKQAGADQGCDSCSQETARLTFMLCQASDASDRAIARLKQLLSGEGPVTQMISAVDQSVSVK